MAIVTIMADIITKDESLGWPTPDEIIKPQPTADQDLLWEKIYQTVSAEDLEKEVKFVRLPLAFRNYLAKNSVANLIGEIGQKFNLVPWQVQKLAKIVRRYFIKEVALVSLDNIIGEELKISLEIAAAIRESLTDILKAVPSVSVPTPPPPPQPVTPPAPPPTPPPAPVTPPPVPRPLPTATPKPLTGDQPFIIYKERPELRETPAPAPSVPKKPEPPKPPLATDAVPSTERTSNVVRVPIKTPSSPSNNASTRMVHYSNFRTPLK